MEKEYEVTEDGVTYVVQELENGGTLKFVKPDDDPPQQPFETLPPLDDSEQERLEMQANIEYLIQLMELSMEEE